MNRLACLWIAVQRLDLDEELKWVGMLSTATAISLAKTVVAAFWMSRMASKKIQWACSSSCGSEGATILRGPAWIIVKISQQGSQLISFKCESSKPTYKTRTRENVQTFSCLRLRAYPPCSRDKLGYRGPWLKASAKITMRLQNAQLY